jgi:hypothetical protein
MSRASKGMMVVAAVVLLAVPMHAQKSKNGTTLAAQKTLEVCDAGGGLWEYSGEISVWNEGVLDTLGLSITDCVQYKLGNAPWKTIYCPPIPVAGEIASGTNLLTATTYPFSFTAAPPPAGSTVRNSASVKILNHSGSMGKAAGPEPKYTFTGLVEACGSCGCTYSQGYWGNKPGVIWPDGFDRSAPFYLSGQTWQEVLDTPPAGGNGYYQLAHQYIATVLNQASGACTSSGIQSVIDAAESFFAAALPSSCSTSSSCGLQKTAAELLDDYIHGNYPGAPGHCDDEYGQ